MSIKTEWTALETKKQPFMQRAEQYARWTIPHVFPPANYTGQIELDEDWESIGAQAVNHLGNKIMLALFAPSRPFFRIDLDGAAMTKFTSDFNVDEVQAKLLLSRAEQDAMKKLVKRNGRTALGEVIQKLIVTGNALLYLPPDGGFAVVYSLRDYCVVRDRQGNIVRILVKEMVAFGTLDEEMQDKVRDTVQGEADSDTEVELFTDITLISKDKFQINQFANDIEITTSITRGFHKTRDLPWIPVTWKLTNGSHYGTGHIEDYQGEFNLITRLTLALVQGGVIASKINFLVNPSGAADIEELNDAENGEYVWGNKDDVTSVGFDKSQDFTFIGSLVDRAEARIGKGFLLNSSVTRDAERVTAEEIRIQAVELETALGGVYSHLAETLQTPLAWLSLEELDIAEMEGLEPLITTGMDSLSRGSEHEQFMLWMNDLAILNGIPEDVRAVMQLNGAMMKMATGRGVKFEDVIKPPEQVQQEQQAAVEQQKEMMDAEAQAKAGAQQPQG